MANNLLDISNIPRRELVKLLVEISGYKAEQISSLADTDLLMAGIILALEGLKKLTLIK